MLVLSGVSLRVVFLLQVSVAAAAGFLLYGGRLFIMLRRFPIESRGRRKKLREVGQCPLSWLLGGCWPLCAC